MNSGSQAVAFNAIPLLVLAALYLFASAALAPTFWRERGRLREVELAVALIYPCSGVAATIIGIAVLVEREPLAGNVWLSLAMIVVALVPALVFVARWHDRSLLLTGSRRAREAEERSSKRDRERAAINEFTTGLARAGSGEAVGTLLVDKVVSLLGVEFAALAVVDGRFAHGLAARAKSGAVEWWRDVQLDLETGSSAIASTAFEAAPLVIYDVESSALVNRGLAERVGAKSAAFVPLIAGHKVIGVLVAATTRERHTFSHAEMTLLGELASESALALEHTRSAASLAEALERERLVGRISQRIRSEFDLDSVLGVAVAETARAIPGISRSFIRLGEPGVPMPVRAEWDAEGIAPIGASAERLPVSNLAARERRTAAVGDISTAPEIEDPSLGGRQTLLDLGTRAVLATPILVFDRMIGVFGLHRPEPCVWTASEIALGEAVAHEIGLAIHTARLLEDIQARVKRQATLLEAAQVLTSDLQFDSVIRTLVDEVVSLVDADSADCWIFDEQRRYLVCRAVQGRPESEIGRETSPEGAIGDAIAAGRPVLASDDARPEHESSGPRAEVMVAPISFLGEIRGVLRIGSKEGDRFDGDDLELLEAFASLASLALRNAEAFEEGSRQARVQRGFYRIAAALAEPLSLSATLDAVAQAASEALGGDFAGVLMPTGGGLELAGSTALPAVLENALSGGLPPGEQTLLAAAAEGRVLAAPSVTDDDRFADEWRGVAEQAPYRSLLAIPVEAPGAAETSGLVLVFFAEPRTFIDDDLEVAQHLAAAAKAALERSGVFEEERTARSLAQQLARTGGLLATELDPAAVLDEVVAQAPRLVGVEACAIRVVEDDELVVTAVAGENAEHVMGSRSPAIAWLSGDVVQSGEPVAIDDAGGDERLLAADPMLGLGYRSYLGVPLAAAEGALHGVLAVYGRRPKDWREAEIEALLALAGNASAALANAELYQRVALEKERNEAILANIADGIVAVDREGNVVLWNNAAEQITGVPAVEAIRRTPVDVLGRDLEVAGRPNQPVTIVRGGDEVFLSVSEAVMRDPAGAVAGRIYAFRDVSTDRLLEQMKSQFVSTVSEQLRRPLTSIYGFAETLLRRDILFGDEERRTFLGYIASESERLTAIVDALLNVARLDSGDLQVELAPTDVGSVVAEVVAEAEGWPALDGHRFVVDLPSEPVTAEADPEKLRLVLANLLDNAVRYSPRGGTVTVVARRRSDAVEVAVADEGVGIPPAEQQRIFRKFYRGGDPAAQGGTGLGLFIVEGLVKAMKGRIRVASAEGEGSTFTVELAAAEPAFPAVSETHAERV